MRAVCLATLPLTLITLTLGLSACSGSATVTATDVVSTTATSTATATSTVSSSSTATTTTTATSAAQPAPAGPVDQPAREVEEIPDTASLFTPQEEAFLEQLRKNGLNVEGVEDQLTATGVNVCANDSITRDAVAGQLVEQRRTDLTPEALGQLITDAARANLCS